MFVYLVGQPVSYRLAPMPYTVYDTSKKSRGLLRPGKNNHLSRLLAAVFDYAFSCIIARKTVYLFKYILMYTNVLFF